MAETERLDGRDGKIWTAYVGGATQEAIAAEHGISQQRVSQVLAEVRDTIGDEARADAALLAQERADALLAAVWPIAMGGDTRAVLAALRVLERQAKALGTDAVEPLKIALEQRLELEADVAGKALTAALDALGLDEERRVLALRAMQASLLGEELPTPAPPPAPTVEDPVDPRAAMEAKLRDLTADEDDVDVDALLAEVDQEGRTDG
ncbi:hypothetical protein O3Q52_47820 [Streptomyces sp. ActVer]|uniref:hypothetical protein n=1 Tax=Streptomyces sp. ActVer TaxID=3014558 RepID=UPI0022B54C3C|nr:hypothetical protein [Streptomyces sp. ActVer]MCZ4515692.1 hypothetical protein [Streptomyces sp. ActVer]